MKQLFPTNYLSKHFSAAEKQESTATKKKRKPPLSIRLNDDERTLLESWAGRTPLSTYVKKRLFADGGKKPRKARSSTSVQDYDTLARLLGALGRTDAFRNLDKLIAMAENGTLDLEDEHIKTVLAVCACVTEMRNDLIVALGLKGD